MGWSVLAVIQTLAGWTTGAASVRAWQALLALLLVIVSCLALTPRPLEGVESGLDKVAHMLAFTVLAFSAYLGFPSYQGGMRMTLLLCLLLVYGGLIEVMQLLVPGRSAEWGDLLADGVGIALGVSLASFLLHLGSPRR